MAKSVSHYDESDCWLNRLTSEHTHTHTHLPADSSLQLAGRPPSPSVKVQMDHT